MNPARVLSVTVLATLAVGMAAAPAAADTVQPGTFRGEGFDACTAPSSATMQAWRTASPYRAIGVYFGGNNRACQQPNLTAEWVAAQTAAGWHLMPIYLGPQASCGPPNKPFKIDNAQAAAQGKAAAEDAVVQARALGLAKESALIYDMEAYATNDAACRTGVLNFMSAWSARLHDYGYASGFYGSMGSGVADQVANYYAPGYVRPDFLDFARWDQVATVSDPAIPSTYWTPRRRMKQYRGDHVETYGSVSINIDNDYLDVAPLTRTAFGDYTGNGWSDVLSRNTTTNALEIHPGNGGHLDPNIRTISTGWGGYSALVRIGDLNRDGREDFVGRVTATGELWFYPGTNFGVGPRKSFGTGWTGLREMTGVGDFNKDGYPDLIAVHTSTGNLYLYPGRSGVGFGSRVLLGTGGWNLMSELAGIGDFNKDGITDLVARLTSNGELFFYPGRAGGFAARQSFGTGWSGLREITGVGDFDRDGFTDLVAVVTANGDVYLYPGNGSGFRSRSRISTGFTNRSPLL